MIPSTDTTLVPNVTRTEYTLVDIDDEEFVSLIDDNGEIRNDLKLPDFPDGYSKN